MGPEQKQFNWSAHSATPAPGEHAEDASSPECPLASRSTPTNSVTSTKDNDAVHDHETDTLDFAELSGPPIAVPLPHAIEHGAFGFGTDGPLELDGDAIAALTQDHAREMVLTRLALIALELAQHFGHDPRTGSPPRDVDAAARLNESLRDEHDQLTKTYSNALAAYAQGFGEEAATQLDAWVRKTCADAVCEAPPEPHYPPTHPWHYYHAGDGAAPMLVDDIPPVSDVGQFIEQSLPKNSAKRLARLQDLLTQERERLAEDQRRYQDIAERGAEALSRYDREIAHTGDEMAVASALALKFTHVGLGLGRVAWIQQQLQRAGVLFGERVVPDPRSGHSVSGNSQPVFDNARR